MKRKIISILIVFLCLVACEDDVFDRQPLDKISDALVWNDPVLLRAYLNDIYVRLPFNNKFQSGSSKGSDVMTEVLSTNQQSQDPINGLTGMTRTTDPRGYWNFAMIRAVNVFLQNIQNSTVPEATKRQMEGEARVMRAMIYLEKQMRYGGVPLVDIVLDPFNPVDKKYTVRSTEEAIADFIDADLSAAIPLLTENTTDLATFNKWTAYAVKARANLWAASIAKYGRVQLNGLVGIPSSRANDFYTKASAAANSVITSGKYSLYYVIPDKSENYRKLFLTLNNGEAILTKIFDGVNFWHSMNMNNLPQRLSGGLGANATPSYDYIEAVENIDGSNTPIMIGPGYLYDNGYQAFAQKDPRLRGTTFFNGDDFGGFTIASYEAIDPNPTPDPSKLLTKYGDLYNGIPVVGEDSRMHPTGQKASRTGFTMKKFCDEERIASNINVTPWMEYRLAEMYLIRAEAEFELGNYLAAATALNATRARAGISLVDQNSITLKHVRTERMSELYYEQHYFYDLRRWRAAEEVLNGRSVKGLRTILHYPTMKIYYLLIPQCEEFTRQFSEQWYYNPITTNRINNNTDLVENPGY